MLLTFGIVHAAGGMNGPLEGGAAQGSSRSHVDPDTVVAERDGDVLLKATLLKSDHFPGRGLCIRDKRNRAALVLSMNEDTGKDRLTDLTRFY